jgi:hypothetical protein
VNRLTVRNFIQTRKLIKWSIFQLRI